MGKDKIVIITKEAKNTINKNNLKIKEDFVYNKETVNSLINIKNKKITIYDVTYIKTNKKEIKVKDHINKTGKNPIIGNQKKLKLDFIDITKIYKNKKEGVVTTSVGRKAFKHNKTKKKNLSTEICNVAILCKALKAKHIEGRLINLFDLV